MFGILSPMLPFAFSGRISPAPAFRLCVFDALCRRQAAAYKTRASFSWVRVFLRPRFLRGPFSAAPSVRCRSRQPMQHDGRAVPFRPPPCGVPRKGRHGMRFARASALRPGQSLPAAAPCTVRSLLVFPVSHKNFTMFLVQMTYNHC